MKDIKGLYLSQILVIVFSALTCISVFLPGAEIGRASCRERV